MKADLQQGLMARKGARDATRGVSTPEVARPAVHGRARHERRGDAHPLRRDKALLATGRNPGPAGGQDVASVHPLHHRVPRVLCSSRTGLHPPRSHGEHVLERRYVREPQSCGRLKFEGGMSFVAFSFQKSYFHFHDQYQPMEQRL